MRTQNRQLSSVLGPHRQRADNSALAAATVAVTSDAGTDDTYQTGDAIEITATFAEAMTVTGTPQIALTIGTTTRQAAYTSGSGTADLVFTYTVAAGDDDADGISIAQDALTLNSGTIVDSDGDSALLTHDPIADDADHTVDTT